MVLPEQFAVPLTRIDPICPSDSECHLLSFLLTAVLGVEMNVGVRVTLDTEFFCRCYAVQPQDFSCCRIQVTLDTVYNCRCYVFICWNGLEVEYCCRWLKILPNCICGKEYSSPLTNCTFWWYKSVLKYSFLYKAQQLKDS